LLKAIDLAKSSGWIKPDEWQRRHPIVTSQQWATTQGHCTIRLEIDVPQIHEHSHLQTSGAQLG
jgi:hypothetical protein